MRQTIVLLVLASLKAIQAFAPYISNAGFANTQPSSGVMVPIPPRASATYKNLSVIIEAKNIEFAFPSEQERKRALASGDYKPNTAIPIDVDVYYESTNKPPLIFITFPRFNSGVPYSVAYLADLKNPHSMAVQPYPSYDWHTEPTVNCNAIQSVYRMQIDACGQMWLLDSGEIGLNHTCPPKLLVFDLHTARLVHAYTLPADMYKPNISRFVTLLVDFADVKSCDHAFVYMADATGSGIVVYDKQAQRSWRVENKYTYPDPAFGTHTIAGQSFELLDGVFGFAVTPHKLNLQRLLYFHSLSGDLQMAIPLAELNNESNWQNGISSSLDKFLVLGKRGIHCGPSAMSAQGFLLCGFLQPIAIYGWYISTPYTAANRLRLAENPETLQFVSGLKVKRNPRGREDVWVVSNRLQKAFTRTTNFEEINYRVQICGFDQLLHRKPCTP